jgi:hypothetical protein
MIMDQGNDVAPRTLRPASPGVVRVGKLHEILKDSDSRVLWIRPITYRGLETAFTIGSDGLIEFAWPREMIHVSPPLSIKHATEDWEIVQPDDVMAERNHE